MIADEEVERRKTLTFEQAEGVAPLPAQLQLKELSQDLRARLWAVVYESFQKHSGSPSTGGRPYFREPWSKILYAMHIYRDGGMADDFDNDFRQLVDRVRRTFEKGDYLAVFGWIQWVLQRTNSPYGFAARIDRTLAVSGAAYRVIDDRVIVPIVSETEKQTLSRAFSDLSTSVFHGARAHLMKAAVELTAGRHADSIRESIHAVESVVRVIEPSAELSKALAKLEVGGRVHGALKSALTSLYGYTSDEEGIRHPLLASDTPNVDETDAIFMIGACASFISYLISKGRSAGILSSE